ncbi:hypothetical protein CR513_04007, partial [Mucuna pruriens]
MPEKFRGIINNITASHHPSFSKDEVPTEGKSHNQPFHITIKCRNYMIARVLINNGSFLNVMPKTTLDKLYSTGSTLKTKWEVMGKITLLIHIGPITFDITSKPWIHAAGVVPSSLHRKVNVIREKELMISAPLPIEYVEGDEEALETSFQALEIVGTSSAKAEEGGPKLSRVAIMATKVLINNGFQPNKGLGKELDGIAELVALQENLVRSRLGYTRITKEGRPWRRAESKNINTETSLQIDNVTLKPENANESSGQDEGEGPEEEALVELERLLEQERPKLQYGAEELEIINLDDEEEAREIQVGKKMTPNLRQRLAKLMKEYDDVFAWSRYRYHGTQATLDPQRGHGPVVAKKDEAGGGIKDQRRSREAMKCMFLSCSRVPPMGGQHSASPQEGWKVRICVDYRDLNRASPKDNFPLPHIDMLVDNIA